MDFLKRNKLYIFFILVSSALLIIYNRWFFSLNIFSSGDWMYTYGESLKNGSLTNNTWTNSSLGQANIGLSLYLIYNLLWYILRFLGYNFVLRLTIFFPIVFISFYSSFLLTKKILGKVWPALLVSSLVFCFNTYFLMLQSGQLTLAAAIAFSPLVILFFIKTLEDKKAKDAIVTGLLCFICSAYEPRVFYIIAFVLLFYYLFQTFIVDNIAIKSILRNSLFALTPILITLFLDLYWIIPSLVSNSIQGSGILNRDLFGNGYMDIKQSLTLFHPFWTGAVPTAFVVQPIPIYFWLIPIFALLGLVLNRKNKYVVFFGIVSLVGIFLSKQVGEPFSNVYPWLFQHFPGFDAFREASKFYLLIALGYSVLIGSFVSWIWNNWKEKKWQIYAKYFFFLLVAFIFLWNAKPLITGEIGTMFVPRHIPQDNLIFKDFILKQSEYSRTYWVPTDSRWSIYTDAHPEISGVDIVQSNWTDLSQVSSAAPQQNQIVNILQQPFSEALFDNSSIEYVIVPIEDVANDDDFFVNYGGAYDPNIRQWYIDQLDQISWLKKIDIGTTDLVVYENENYRPHIYTTASPETIYRDVPYANVSSTQINPTEYTVHLTNVTSSVFVNFSESFDPNWKVRVGSFAWYDAFGANYFLPDAFHSESDATLSSFLIDPRYIRQNLPASAYTVNPDGSIDIDLTLYFKPQSYFYVGLIISGGTLLACLGYLGWEVGRRRKKKTVATATIKEEENV